MANPWQLSYDEDGNLIPAQYDAASASEADRSPASAGFPLMLTAKGKSRYNAATGKMIQQAAKAAQMTAAPQAPEPAPQVTSQPMPVAGIPQMNPQGIGAMKQDVGFQPGAFGNQVQEKNQLTEGQKQDIQHTLFQSPERARLNMLQAMGLYAQPLRDENGNIVKDSDGNIVYDPNNVVADPNHPYQQSLMAIKSARELLMQKMKYAPNQTDLSPLMAYVDQQVGKDSHLAASYSPHTYAQAAEAAQAQIDKLNEEQISLGREAQSGANNMRAGQQNTALTMQMLQSQLAGVGMGGMRGIFQPAQMQQQFAKQAHAEGHQLQSEGNILNNAIQLLSQGNPSANPTIKTTLARFIEGTVRPQLAVIGQEGGDQSIIQSVLNRLETIQSGEMTDEQVGQYKAELQAFLKAHNQNVSSFSGRMSTMNRSLPLPFSDPDLSNILGPYSHPHGDANAVLSKLPNAKNIVAPGTKNAPPPPVQGGFMDFWQQYKKQNPGG